MAVNVRVTRAEAEAVAAEVRACGVRAAVAVADVSDEEAVEGMFAQVSAQLGPVSILVNNAGPRSESPIDRLSRSAWDTTVGAVLTGAFLCCRRAVGPMKVANYGRIVNILGAVAHTGQSDRAHLAAAKAGLLGLTRALAVELGSHGITVNAVSPGPLDVAPPPGLDPAERLRRARQKPVARLGTLVEVAAMVGYLTSPDASFITGQAIAVNGGEVMLG